MQNKGKLYAALATVFVGMILGGCEVSSPSSPTPTPSPTPPVSPDPDPTPDPLPTDPISDPEPDEPEAPDDGEIICVDKAPYDDDEFSCIVAGKLLDGSSIAGGSTETTIWIPNMRFPIKTAPAFINSQVYRYGGSAHDPNREGPDGNPFGPETWQCDAKNYAFPWKDNFCESRGYATDFCPSGTGHQGLDIRDATCQAQRENRSSEKNIVAIADGYITRVLPHSTRLVTDDGAVVDYLHMKNGPGERTVEPEDLSGLANAQGVRVLRGDPLGSVGRILNSSGALTTYHLHIEVRIPITDDITGTTDFYPVPMCETMKEAYLRLEAGNP